MDEPTECLPPLPPSPTLGPPLLNFSLSSIPMDNSSDATLEDGETLDATVSGPAPGAPLTFEQNSFEPQQKAEVPTNKDSVKAEPGSVVTMCDESLQPTSVSLPKEGIETNADLDVVLETPPMPQRMPPSTHCVSPVMKEGASYSHPEDGGMAESRIPKIDDTVVAQETCSDATDPAHGGAPNEVGSNTSQAIDSPGATNTVPNSSIDSASTVIQQTESNVAEATVIGSRYGTKPTPALVKEDRATKTPLGGHVQDFLPPVLIETSPSLGATMASDSLSKSLIVSSQEGVAGSHLALTSGHQKSLNTTSQPSGETASAHSTATKAVVKSLQDIDTLLRKDMSPLDRPVIDTPSVPPHRRPPPAAPRSFGPADFRRHISLLGLPQEPPPRQPQYTSAAMRNREREELLRVQAQNMQLRKELETERERNEKMQVLQASDEKDIDTILGPILAAHVHEKIAMAKEKTTISQQKVELERRSKLIEQQEVFLAAGQRELYYQANTRDIPTLSIAEHVLVREQGAVNAKATTRVLGVDLQLDYDELKIQKVELENRQQIYKALVRRKIEADLTAVLENEFELRTSQIANEAYDRGYKEGKEKGLKEIIEDANEAAFAEGYATARQQQTALAALKNGILSYDSSDLDFMNDLNHPNNLFNMGMQVGRHETVVKKVRKIPPVRPTIFEQINGPSPKINGKHILANRQSMTSSEIPNLMDDIPNTTIVNSTSIHNQHALANHKAIPVSMTPNLMDDDTAPTNLAAKHPSNTITQTNGAAKQVKEQHLFTDGKVSHVNGRAVLANSNAGINNTNRIYTSGSAASATGESALDSGVSTNGNTHMINEQPTPQSTSESGAENLDSSRRMPSRPSTAHRRPDELAAAESENWPKGLDYGV